MMQGVVLNWNLFNNIIQREHFRSVRRL